MLENDDVTKTILSVRLPNQMSNKNFDIYVFGYFDDFLKLYMQVRYHF